MIWEENTARIYRKKQEYGEFLQLICTVPHNTTQHNTKPHHITTHTFSNAAKSTALRSLMKTAGFPPHSWPPGTVVPGNSTAPAATILFAPITTPILWQKYLVTSCWGHIKRQIMFTTSKIKQRREQRKPIKILQLCNNQWSVVLIATVYG